MVSQTLTISRGYSIPDAHVWFYQGEQELFLTKDNDAMYVAPKGRSITTGDTVICGSDPSDSEMWQCDWVQRQDCEWVGSRLKCSHWWEKVCTRIR